MQRRKFLRALGASGAAASGLTALSGTAAANESIHVVLHRDYYSDDATLSYVADHIHANFDEWVPDVDVFTTESTAISQPDVHDAYSNNDNLVECWSKYVYDAYDFYENTIRMYVCNSQNWEDTYDHPEGPGVAAGNGSVNKEGSHGMNDLYDDGLNPVCCIEGEHTNRDSTRDEESVKFSAAHELGHLCMSPDHNAHKVANWYEDTYDNIHHSVMTVLDDNLCQASETERYPNPDNNYNPFDDNEFADACGTAIDEWVNNRSTNDGLAACHYE